MDRLRKVQITSELLKTISEIDEFKGRWLQLGRLAPERLSALRRVATIESVGSSTRIEGVKLSNEEVEKLLSGLNPRSFRSRDEEEVAGYAELIEQIFKSFTDTPFSENIICQLHGILLKYSQKDERHRGKYKTLSNQVEAFDEQGLSLGVIFETASPFDTPRLMEALVDGVGEAIDDGEHHILLIIAVFVVRFLAIHPFQDGNGRLSRALTTLLLLRSGYTYVPYSSLEKIVEDNKDAYYTALRRAQSTLDRDESRLVDWLVFFIRTLAGQKEVLDRKISQEKLMAPLALLSEKLLSIVREHGRVTVREAAVLTKANRNTIKDHLKQLVNTGHLIQCGQGRGTWYEYR